MRMIWNDIRYALRLMRRNPGFTSIAVLSLALGIGANTAIFSLFNTIVLHKLPVAHPEQLVEFLQDHPGQPLSSSYWDWESYELFRDHNHVFSALTGMSFDNLASIRVEGSDSETLIQENVLGNYFRVLGLTPAIGRFFTPEDVPASGIGSVVVVSWSYWNSQFNRDPGILGKRIFVGNEPKTIIGVAPRAYSGPRVGVQTDIWAPQEHRSFTILARLKPGVTVKQAQAEMSVLYRLVLKQRALRSKAPRAVEQTTMQVEPAATGLVRVRDQYGKPLLLLMAVVGLLLLLACINMASMLLARSAGRQREMALRVGLGASRSQLARQMLTESIILSIAGMLFGTLFAFLGTGVLVRIMASGQADQHIEIQVKPDLYLLLFTAGIALLTGLLFGLAPAWHAFRFDTASALRQSGKGGDTWRWRLFGKGLVTAQVALSIFLVTGAAVFLKHVAKLRNFDLGFRSDHVLLATLDPTHSGYGPEQLGAIYQTLLPRLETIPGVRSASITGCTPLQGCGAGGRYLIAEGFAEPPANRRRTQVTFVSPRYFETLGIPLIAGRDFTFRDASRSRVAVVSQAMARRYFPGIDPIGKHVVIDTTASTWFGGNQPYEIVGVVGDVKAIELRGAPFPTMYFNMFQENRLVDQFQLRTSVNPTAVASAVRQIVRDALKTVPVTRVTTLAGQVDSNIVPERLIAVLAEFFGALGAVLAGIGIYGLLAYTVARRTSEVGVRMALGATASDVSGLVLREALAMVGGGFIVGIMLVLISRPLVMRLVQDLKPDGAAALIAAGWIIFGVTLMAASIPVRKAIRVDPMVALRHD
jgi:putative ABC transport system permease protein